MRGRGLSKYVNIILLEAESHNTSYEEKSNNGSQYHKGPGVPMPAATRYLALTGSLQQYPQGSPHMRSLSEQTPVMAVLAAPSTLLTMFCLFTLLRLPSSSGAARQVPSSSRQAGRRIGFTVIAIFSWYM